MQHFKSHTTFSVPEKSDSKKPLSEKAVLLLINPALVDLALFQNQETQRKLWFPQLNGEKRITYRKTRGKAIVGGGGCKELEAWVPNRVCQLPAVWPELGEFLKFFVPQFPQL